MIETIKHLLGFCGEPHGLAHILLIFGGSISGILTFLKFKYAKENIHYKTMPKKRSGLE